MQLRITVIYYRILTHATQNHCNLLPYPDPGNSESLNYYRILTQATQNHCNLLPYPDPVNSESLFSMILIDFYWLPLIFIDYDWFSWISIDLPLDPKLLLFHFLGACGAKRTMVRLKSVSHKPPPGPQPPDFSFPGSLRGKTDHGPFEVCIP